MHGSCANIGLLTIAIAILLSLAMSAANSSPITVRTLNIRYDNPRDPEPLDWKKRRSYISAMIKSDTHETLSDTMRSSLIADLIGLQEVERNQLRDIKNELGEAYYVIGRGRDRGSRGEHNPILIRKERFDVIHSATLWLAPNAPSSPRRAFGARLNRIVTFANVYDKHNMQSLWVFNTHLTHENREIRAKQAEVLISIIEDHARSYKPMDANYFNDSKFVGHAKHAFPYMDPIIVTGDFNDIVGGEMGRRVLQSQYSAPIRTYDKTVTVGSPVADSLLVEALDPLLGSPNDECFSQFPCQVRFPIGKLVSALQDATQMTKLGHVDDNSLAHSIDWILHNNSFTVEQVSETKHNLHPKMYLSDLHNMLTAVLNWSDKIPEKSMTSSPLELHTHHCCDFNVTRVELSEIEPSEDAATSDGRQ